MDPALKAKWCAALRSGRYEQGRGALRNPADQFCCLGVLADVIDPAAWKNEDPTTFSTWNSQDLFLPGDVLSGPDQRILGEMNDRNPQTSFSTIATWIEENL